MGGSILGQRPAARHHGGDDEPADGRFQPERFPNSLLGQGSQGDLICQIDADERRLREAIELAPAGAEAEFRVRIQDRGRLRPEGITLTSPS